MEKAVVEVQKPKPKKFQYVDKSKLVKTFLIERQAPETVDLFKRMCKEKKKQPRLTKGKFLAYLSRRYKSHVAKIIAQFFDWRDHYELDSFSEELEQLMNFKKEKLMQMAF